MFRRGLSSFSGAVLAALASVAGLAWAAPASIAQPAELAQLTCDQLWLRRNDIFAQHGYCFTSPRGQAAFGKQCFPPYGKLTAEAQQQVNVIAAVEQMKGCTSPASVSAPAPLPPRSVAVKLDVPIVIGGDARYDACSSTGAVAGLDPWSNSFLSVRTGPETSHMEFDRLNNGRELYLCGEMGAWRAVIYPAPGQEMRDCGVSMPWPKAGAYGGPCSHGWVHSDFIREVAG